MGARLRRYSIALAALAVLAIPSGGMPALGQTTSVGALQLPDEGVLHLHLASDGTYFRYDPPPTGAPAAPSVTQTIDAARCQVGLTGPALVALDAGSKKPGISFESLGVKTGGAQGVACGRVDTTETLALSLGSASAIAGKEIAYAELDVEVKQDAWVLADLYWNNVSLGTYQLRSGSSIDPTEGSSTSGAQIFNCGAASDSGPDSGANDNCRWVIDPATPFNRIVFHPVVGEFGLEGGEDGTPAATLGSQLGTLDSLFKITDISGYLDCGDTVTQGDGTTTPQADLTRLDNADCAPVPYILQTGVDESGRFVDFEKDLSGQPDATFRMSVTWPAEPAQFEVPATTIDYGDGPIQVQWCDGTAADPATVAGGQPWCVVSQSTVISGPDGSGDQQMTVTEEYFGTFDPIWGRT